MEPSAALPESEPRKDRTAQRARKRHAAVQELLSQGRSVAEITRELGLARNTVRRFARAAAEDLLVNNGTGKRSKIIKPYLRRRFQAGCTNATTLWRELQELGYTGGGTSVSYHIRPWRKDAAPPPPRPRTVREVTAWITCCGVGGC